MKRQLNTFTHNGQGFVSGVFVKIIVCVTALFLLIAGCEALFTLHDSASLLNSLFSHPVYLLVIGAVVLTGFFFCFFKAVDRCRDKSLKYFFILFIALLIVFQVLFIAFYDVQQITDAYIIRDQALAIARGMESQVDYGATTYFARYGNNSFALWASVVFYKLLMRLNIRNDSLAFEVLNAVLIDIGVVLVAVTARLVKDRRFALKVLAFCVLNPLNYLLICWTYTCTYSIALTAAAVCIGMVIWKKRPNMVIKAVLCALTGVIAVVGYLLRPTVLIPLVAAAICAVLLIRRLFTSGRAAARAVILILIILLAAAGSYTVFQKKIRAYVPDSSSNFPPTHWVMMGLHGDGTFNGEDEAYTASFPTKEEKTEANIDEIIATLKEYGVSGTLAHLLGKIGTTWSDGTGMYLTYTQQNRTISKVHQWVSGEKPDLMVLYCQVFRIVTLMLALYSVIGQIRSRAFDWRFLFTLTLFGGILFYLIWEAKSSYSAPFIPFLCLLAAEGLDASREGAVFKALVPHRKKIGYAVMAATLLTLICCYYGFTHTPYLWHNYSVYSFTPQLIRYDDDISSGHEQLTQEFCAENSFNEIRIYGQRIDDGEGAYSIRLLNDEDEVLAEHTASGRDLSYSWLTLSFPSISPEGRQAYRIVIEPLTPGSSDTIRWGHRFSKASDQYDGSCYLDGNEQSYDLFIRVSEAFQSPYMKAPYYCAAAVLLLLIEYRVLVWDSDAGRRRDRIAYIQEEESENE